jgi:hypothetical protein
VRCYYHPQDREAVALCTNCSRGLCPECAKELVNATACSNRCETEALAIKEIIERGKTGYQKAASIQMRNAIIYILMALVIAALGLLTLPGGWIMVALGVVFLIGAGFSYSASKKMQRVAP